MFRKIPVLFLLLLAACAQASPSAEPTPTPTPTRTAVPTGDPGALAQTFKHVQSTDELEIEPVLQHSDGDAVVILVSVSEFQSMYPTLEFRGYVSELGTEFPDQDPNEALSRLRIALQFVDGARLDVRISPIKGGFVTYIANTVKLSEVSLVDISFAYPRAKVTTVEIPTTADKRLWEITIDTRGFWEWYLK